MTLNSPKIIEILEDKVIPGSMHLQGGENFSAGGINELMLFTHVPKYQPGSWYVNLEFIHTESKQS